MKKLENKWLILDTNVVIELSINPDHEFWADFEQKIKELNCFLLITNEIAFELLRSLKSPHEEDEMIAFLKKNGITVSELGVSEIWKKTTKLAQTYPNSKSDKTIEAIDCITGAYLKAYPDRLFMATFNHKDFPSDIYDRVGMLNFEIKNEIKVLGFYTFSKTKFAEKEGKFKTNRASKK